MPHLFRENLCKKQYCNVTKTNRFVLKILEKLNHFVLKVRTGGFADSIRLIIKKNNHEENFYSGMFVYPIGGVRK